jgi:AcrR family transcriptional regulator
MTRQETRSRILAAAAELFGERGYLGTTTSAIADAAGVNEVTLFRHFESKLGIVQALGQTFDVSDQPYPPPGVIVPGDVRATLQNLAALEIEAAVAGGALVLRLSFDARSVPELRDAMGAVSGSNRHQLAAWLEEQQAVRSLRTDIDATDLAEAFYSLTSTQLMARMAVGSRSPSADEIRDLAERQTRVLWTGIGPQDD